MKTLMTLFTGIMLIGCAGADHQSTRVALASSAVFHAETKPTPTNGSKAVTGIRYPSLKIALVLVGLDHFASFMNANDARALFKATRLRNALKRSTRAFLFTGLSGTGKTMAA